MSTEAGRLYAAMLIVAQPGTAEITHYQAEMSQAQRGAFVTFKETPGL